MESRGNGGPQEGVFYHAPVAEFVECDEIPMYRGLSMSAKEDGHRPALMSGMSQATRVDVVKWLKIWKAGHDMSAAFMGSVIEIVAP